MQCFVDVATLALSCADSSAARLRTENTLRHGGFLDDSLNGDMNNMCPLPLGRGSYNVDKLKFTANFWLLPVISCHHDELPFYIEGAEMPVDAIHRRYGCFPALSAVTDYSVECGALHNGAPLAHMEPTHYRLC
jgi:hypothetical protein